MFPGDVLNNGKVLPVLNGNFFGDGSPAIYLTPSIKYASNNFYARPYSFNGRIVKVIIQCRVKPGSFTKYRETVRARGVIDNNFPNDEIEWVTHDRLAVVPYGLLIGVF